MNNSDLFNAIIRNINEIIKEAVFVEKEFNFKVKSDDEQIIFKALEITDTGIYRVSWNDDEDFKLYLPEHVAGHLKTGRWILV